MIDLTELVNYIYAAIAAAGVGAFAVAARHYLSDKAAEHVEALVEELAAMLLSRYQAQGIGLYDAMRFRGGEPGDWAMLHLDTRPAHEAACWLGEGREPVRYTVVRPGELMRRAINLQAQHAL